MEIENVNKDNERPTRKSFDDVPVGLKNTSNMFTEQHPPGYVQQPVFQQEQPLQKRIVSKVWKVRQQAYEQLISKCNMSVTEIQPFQQQFSQLLSDSNINCQERAFRLLEGYILKKHIAASNIKNILKCVIDKGLCSNKQQISKMAANIVLELFGKGLKTEVYNALSEGLQQKNPKIPIACVQTYSLLLSNFGVKKLQMLKPIMKHLEPYLQTTNTNLRNSIGNFFKQSYKWMGEALVVFSSRLKKPLSQELDKFVKTYTRVPMVPLRQSQTQALEMKADKAPNIDVYDLADPVDVISKYDQSWSTNVLQTVKWSQKKEMLDVAIAAFSTPKILPKDHYHLITLIKKLLSENNNVALGICAMRLAKNLALGLRRQFSQGAKILSSLILSKFKDKKTQIVEEAHATAAALLLCINLEDILQPIKDGLADKAPGTRVQTIKFLKKCLSKKEQKTMKGLLELIIKLTTDGALQVRDEAINLICQMRTAYGQVFFGDKLRDIQSQKLQKALRKSQTREPEQTIPESAANSNSTITVTSKIPSTLPSSMGNRREQPSDNTARNQDLKMTIRTQPQNNSYGECNLSNPSEAGRLQAYQSLLMKPLSGGFQILNQKSIKQSNPNILRAILTILQRTVPELTRNHLQYLMLHDWKKAKNFLSDYLLSAKISPDSIDYIKQTPLLRQILIKEMKPKLPLVLHLHSFIPKIININPLAKLQGAQAMAALIQQNKGADIDYCMYVKQINELCNVIKCRISESDPQIAKAYIQLARLMTKYHILNKTRGKIILPAIINRITELPLQPVVAQYMTQNLQLCPGYLFSYLPLMLQQQELRTYLLSFINDNIQHFFKTADFKLFLQPLFNCMTSSCIDVAVKAQRILDSIIEPQDQIFLQKNIRQLKLKVPEAYLQKKGLEKNRFSQSTTMPSLQRLLSKSQRLREEPSNPWPVVPSPPHIYQLVALLPQLPPPLNQLATLLPVSLPLIQKLVECPLLAEFSDIIVKWLFWRFQIQRSEGVLLLFKVVRKLLLNGLEQIQLIILLSGLLGVLKLGPQVMEAICSFHQSFKPPQLQKVFRFWVNLIKESSIHANEILHILRVCFHDILRLQLVELATYPAVKTNQDFIKYLTDTYDSQQLQVCGFELNLPITRRSMLLEQHTLDPLSPIVQHFKTKQPSQILTIICRQVYLKPPQQTIAFHSKLLKSLASSSVLSKLRPQTFATYIASFTKQLLTLPIEGHLIDISRNLVSLLMQLDEKKPISRPQNNLNIPQPTNNSEMIRVVNGCMLKLLDIAPVQSMFQAMFILIREQLSKSNDYNKKVAVMCKCLGKLVKGQCFYNANILQWLLQQILTLLDLFYFNYPHQQTCIHKTLKVIVSDALNNQPQKSNPQQALKYILGKHSGNSFSRYLLGNLLEDKNNPLQQSMISRLNNIKAKCTLNEGSSQKVASFQKKHLGM